MTDEQQKELNYLTSELSILATKLTNYANNAGELLGDFEDLISDINNYQSQVNEKREELGLDPIYIIDDECVGNLQHLNKEVDEKYQKLLNLTHAEGNNTKCFIDALGQEYHWTFFPVLLPKFLIDEVLLGINE